MSTRDDDDLDNESGDGERPDLRRQREHIRNLERDVDTWKAKAEAAAQVPELERELAFRRAGIDPEDPKAKWLYKGYDGELTADAIKAAAADAGVLGQAQQQGQQQQDNLDDEVGRMSRSSAAATGRNPNQDAEFDELMAQAAREQWPEHKFDDVLRRFGRIAEEDTGTVNPNYW